jgi:hypothetical protein
MRKLPAFHVLLILAFLFQSLAAQTIPQAVKKKRKTYPPLSLFRKKSKSPKGLIFESGDLTLETRHQPITDWTDRYGLNEFLSTEYGTQGKKPTEEEKIGVAAADIGGKICAVIAALAVLGVTQKK